MTNYNYTYKELKTFSREALIDIAISIDSDGVYSDADSISEGYAIITKKELLEILKRLLNI